jgi:hypothetical protein
VERRRPSAGQHSQQPVRDAAQHQGLAPARAPALTRLTARLKPDVCCVLQIAYLGDINLGANGEAVYRLISESERAHAVVMVGDLDYRNDARAWADQIRRTLHAPQTNPNPTSPPPPPLPVFVAAGNHGTVRAARCVRWALGAGRWALGAECH